MSAVEAPQRVHVPAAQASELWRHIGRAATEGMTGPACVQVRAVPGLVDIQLPADRRADVDLWLTWWAAHTRATKATAAMSEVGEFGQATYSTRAGSGSAVWRGWAIHIWCWTTCTTELPEVQR